MRRTCVPRKVRRSTKLGGVRRFTRITDFNAPETLTSIAQSTCGKGKLFANCVCKVLTLIKVVLVKDDYFLHPIFELHRCQQKNGFLYWRSFQWRKYGTYISHKLLVRLIPTWIWYDLLTVSRIWPSNHHLSYFFEFCQFKVAKQLESIALRSFILKLLCLLWKSKIHK